MNIGDVWAALRIDGSKAKGDATKAGGEAGTAASKSLGSSLKKGAALVGGAVAGALSVALIGRFAALEKAQANFRQETGATAEEATKAGKAINAMAGRNLQSIDEIGETLIKVHTDLGLVGEEAEKVTEQFLKFGQATGQDAASAVLAFDDILDAWGLTAADSGAIMDKLVLSHQEYGGSIDANMSALSDLAPAMRAANLTYDDGIGLLNLFAASGLDAADAPAALTKALGKVKSPEQLQRLIDDITATEDPLKRAAKAADLFGARAGAKLANALANGGIDEYTVSLEESVGATDKAADASMTMADRIKQALSGVVSTAVDLFGPAGPLLTGVASLGTLLAPALKGAWTKLGGNKALKLAIAGAGTAAGAIYSAAPAAGSALMSAVSAAWVAIGGPGSKAMVAARAAGSALGLSAASAAVIGAAALVLAIPITFVLLQDVGAENYLTEQEKKLALFAQQQIDVIENTGRRISDLTDQQLGDLYLMAAAWGSQLDQMIADGKTVDDAIAELKLQPGEYIDDSVIAQMRAEATKLGRAVSEPMADLDWGAADVPDKIRGVVDAATGAITKGGPKIAGALGDVIDYAYVNWRAGMFKLVDSMRVAVVDMKERIESGKAGIIEQFRDLAWQTKHPFAEVRYAKWLGDKFDDAMAKSKKATKDGRPGLAAQWLAVADGIKTEINTLPGAATAAAKATLLAMSPIMEGVFAGFAHIREVFGGLPGHAAGGPASGWSVVGERGPELHWSPPGSHVFSNAQSEAMVAGAGDQHSTLEVIVRDPDGGLARAGIGTTGLADAVAGALGSSHIRYLNPRGR